MQIKHFYELDSTNKYLKDNYKELDNLTFVSTDYQTAGRGRYDRKWSSNKGENLLLSFLIKDAKLIKKFSSISLLTAAVVYKEITKLGIKDVSIKWPNDVYIKDNKVTGILLEGISINNDIEALIVGIGVNVNQQIFEKDLKATSLALSLEKSINLREFKESIISGLVYELMDLAKDKSDYLDIIKNNNYLLNKECFATYNGEEIKIKVLGINDDNSLRAICGDKELSFSTGEISFHKQK